MTSDDKEKPWSMTGVPTNDSSYWIVCVVKQSHLLAASKLQVSLSRQRINGLAAVAFGSHFLADLSSDKE